MVEEMTAEEVVATMHIGELADRSQMSLRTIRHYDEVGLLKPSGRTEGGFRLYTERDFARLLVIRRMKPLGFTLEAMAELLRVVDALEATEPGQDDTAIRSELVNFIEEAQRRRAKLEEQLAMADEFLSLLRAQ
ncbi:MerR family transcriptional regulator [Pseudarthrobacter enclensis]|uniref:MerR family transcriptional regulator n=1 Tax=Pseudarthrobacter enclensis TaxID=993070 RepID=UPI00368548A6